MFLVSLGQAQAQVVRRPGGLDFLFQALEGSLNFKRLWRLCVRQSAWRKSMRPVGESSVESLRRSGRSGRRCKEYERCIEWIYLLNLLIHNQFISNSYIYMHFKVLCNICSILYCLRTTFWPGWMGGMGMGRVGRVGRRGRGRLWGGQTNWAKARASWALPLLARRQEARKASDADV